MLTLSDYILNGGDYLTAYGDYTKAEAILGIFEMEFFNLYFQFADLLYMLTGVKL